MRNRITYILATLVLVIMTSLALVHPVSAAGDSIGAPPPDSSGPSSGSGPLDVPSSGAFSGGNAFNTDTTNLSSSNPSYGTSLDVPTSGAFSGTDAPGSSGTTPPGNIISSGAANSGTAGTSPLIACNSYNPFKCINVYLANGANIILNLVSVLVAIAGSIMSFTIVLTLHIRDFVNATPAIFEVWTTLRDVTSLFFIFFLLLAAFKIILGSDEKVGELIKNLVVAGILINFSFFITGALIDASNIVSQTLYNAMVPVSVTTAAANDIQSGNMNAILTDVTGMSQSGLQNVDNTKYGISDIFRNALKLTSIKGGPTPSSTTLADTTKIFFIAVVGIVIMITAGLSFIAAAIAFIIRLVTLIFLLALSPLWFASWIIPQIKKKFDFPGRLFPQLIFMPVYLLLMYIGLKVIAGSNMLAAASAQIPTAGGATNWIFSYIVLCINFAIVIVILNLPLFVALAMSGNLSKNFLEKFDASTIWKKFGSQVGSRSLGRLAYGINERITPKLAAASPLLGSLSNTGLSKVSKFGFGAKKGDYENRLKEKKKAEEALHKKIADLDETRYNNTIKDADDKTELDYAKIEAKDRQAIYRSKLPWGGGGLGGKVSSVIGFMVDNRANRQSAGKLNKKAKDEQKKEDKKEAQKEKTELIKEKKSIDAGTSGHTTEAQKEARKKQINDRIEELDEKISEGKEVEDKEREDKFSSQLDSINNKVEGGGGDKGGDKK